MNRTRWIWILGLASLLLSCSGKGPEDEIREIIREGAAFAEEHDVGGLLALSTQDFVAYPGKRDRRATRGILWMTFRHYKTFRILYPEPGVDLEGDGRAASARVFCLIVREKQASPRLEDLYKDPRGWLEEVGEKADLYRLDLDWIKDGDHWLVSKARLEPFSGIGFSN